jgi:hypothetical protein
MQLRRILDAWNVIRRVTVRMGTVTRFRCRRTAYSKTIRVRSSAPQSVFLAARTDVRGIVRVTTKHPTAVRTKPRVVSANLTHARIQFSRITPRRPLRIRRCRLRGWRCRCRYRCWRRCFACIQAIEGIRVAHIEVARLAWEALMPRVVSHVVAARRGRLARTYTPILVVLFARPSRGRRQRGNDVAKVPVAVRAYSNRVGHA